MPPTKESCSAYKSVHQAYSILLDKWKTVTGNVNSTADLLSGLKAFSIDILDTAASDILSTIYAASSQVSSAVLGAVSNASAAAFELLFSELLKILLFFPTAIFSLISIPHAEATRIVNEEYVFLIRARANLLQILRIIAKWTDRQTGSEYYAQMKEALPLIQEAIKLAEYLMNSLNAVDSSDSTIRNAYFDKSKYNKMQSLLNRAINITKPISIVDGKLNFSRILEEKKQEEYLRRSEIINSKYDTKRKELSAEHSKRSSAISLKGPIMERAKAVVELERIDAWYAGSLSYLKARQSIELSKAQVEAEAVVLAQKSTWARQLGAVGTEFWEDARTIKDQLSGLLNNMKEAYSRYQQSRVLCNNMYNMQSLIRSIISQVIAYMRKTGNAASEIIIGALQTSAAFMTVARDTYLSATAKFESPDIGISSSELATSVAFGNTSLLSASNTMNATVTDELIATINADEALSGADENFRQFIVDLANIPDWDGTRNVWAVDLVGGSPSGYIQSIADITSMLTLVPALSFGGSEKNQKKVRRLVREVYDSFGSIFNHNAQVSRVLSSYTPYMSNETGNLKRILSSIGMLRSFAVSMSLITLVKEMSGLTKIWPLSGDFPTYDECSRLYSDTMDPSILKSVAAQRSNIPHPALTDLNAQKNLEENSIDRIGLIEEAKNFDRHSMATSINGNAEADTNVESA